MVNKVLTHVALIVSSGFLVLISYLFFPTTLSHLNGGLCLTSLTERNLLTCNLNFYLAINVFLFLIQILVVFLALISSPFENCLQTESICCLQTESMDLFC